MPHFVRRLLAALIVFLAVCSAAMRAHASAPPQSQPQNQAQQSAFSSVQQQQPQTTTTPAGTPSAGPRLPSDPRALYQALNALRPDSSRVYKIKFLSLRRDVLSITLEDGQVAFVQPLGGRITGMVFAGRGHAIAIPHDPGERRSLAEFTGVPILDQSFSRAYFRFDDNTAEEISRELARAGDVPSTDADFTENWDPIFANTNAWHSLRILEDWLSSSPRPYFYAGILSDAHGIIDLVIDRRREEQVLVGNPRRLGNGSFGYDVWASFRAQDAPQGSTDAFVPVGYKIDTKIADDLSLDGTTTMNIKAVRGGDRVVPLELSRKLAVASVKDASGAPLVYFQNEDLSKRQIQKRGNDTMLVVLPAPAAQGQQIQLAVSYHGSVITDAGNGVEYVGEHETWYAHPAGIGEFARFDLSFRWPRRYTLVATGKEVESHDEGDFESGRWVSQLPLAVAGFNLGEYKEATANASEPRIQLYANRELESAILAHLQRQSPLRAPPFRPDSPNLPPATLAGPPPPDPASVLKTLGEQILDSIHFYERLNGPFPFGSLEISQIPGTVGQGWPGLVYLSTYAFLPPDQHAGIPELSQRMAHEIMPFHEVAHQWWGNVTTAATYRDVWIEEGMANYLSLLYADSRKPAAHRLDAWLELFRSALLAQAPGTARDIEQAGPLTLGYRLASSEDPAAYNTIVYDKGTWVMHMIREMLRDPSSRDPDARFREFLQTILAQYRFKPLSTEDFQHALEKQMTPSMDLEGDHTLNWFFGEWVKNTGVPRYSVQYETRRLRRGFVVRGTLRQDDVDDLFTAPVPIYAARAAGAPVRLGVVVTTGPETTFRFSSRVRPTRLLIDPELTLLCTTK
ncbi:MAG TPA: M1 family aminopeptidase [Candidatus Acidoferrales bacterium]|nr:M1 family aminopeptidase [Candidatus Acidoferrales bacterium]